MWRWISDNWQVLLVVAAVGASALIAREQARTTATAVATKASKVEVARAAAIIYDGSLKVCLRLNENPGAEKLDCHELVPVPPGVVIEDGKAVAEVDARR